MHYDIHNTIKALTLYRVLAAPVLLTLILLEQLDIFKWMLAISFATDAVDGWLARRYNAVSEQGATLDSIGDDLTVAAGIIGALVFKPDVFRSLPVLLFILVGLYLFQLAAALIKYRRMTSFHTILSKVAAVLQAVFLILLFLLPQPSLLLFHLTVTASILALVEEIAIILVLPKWRTDIPGIIWLLFMRDKNGEV